ncbi:MAG: Integral rane protein [Marmoricola sp.]|nr:Integral rane protein [Marmoricola sp.]
MTGEVAVPWHRPMSGRGPRRGPPCLDPARAVRRPLLRRRRGGRGQHAAPRPHRRARRRPGRLRDGVLRDLVGLGELLVVRQRLRHRRRQLPAAHLRGDDGRPRPRGRRARGGRDAARLRADRGRLPDHAGRDDPALAPRGPRASRGPGHRPALRRGGRGDPGPLGPAPGPLRPRHHELGQLHRVGRPRDAGTVLGRAPLVHPLAPAPHGRALRAVHHHRPGRGHPGDDAGHLQLHRRARARGAAGAPDRRRPAPGVLHVVDLLQAPDGRLPASRHLVRVRLRPRLRLRLGGGRRRLPGGAGRRRRAPRPHREPQRRAAARDRRVGLPAGDRRDPQPGRPVLATAVPALLVVAVIWVVALVGLAPGTSVLLVGLAVAGSLADHVRRTNRVAAAGVSA